MNAPFPGAHGAAPHPPRHGPGAGWIAVIVVAGLVAVAGIVVGVVVVLNRGGSTEAGGKYGTARIPGCDDVAGRTGTLPPKSTGTDFGPGRGWVCTFARPTGGLTVTLDLEVSTVRQQRTALDVATSSGAAELDPTVGLGENAAWGVSGTGKQCDLTVWDSNARFKVGLADGTLTTDDVSACREKVKTIAQTFYTAVQPR